MSEISHNWVLKFTIAISIALAPVALFAADSIDLVVRAIDVGQNPTANVLYTLTPTGPLRRTYGTNLVTVSQKSLRSDANGVVIFTNTLWGNWDLDIPGSSPTSFRLWITTNYSGRQSAALYVTNSSAMPPNPTASYYTQGQVDALIAEKGGGSGATNAVNTVQTNGTPVVTAATVINFVAGTNATVDVSGNGSTATVTIGSTAEGTGGVSVAGSGPIVVVTSNGVATVSAPGVATVQDITSAVSAVSAVNNGSTNIEFYGATHNTRQLVGNITSGSATVTVTSGSVTSADVGRYAKIRFGTSPVQDAVGTIAAVSGSTLTFSKTLGWSTNATDLYIAAHDDADALQAAMTDAQAKGGATILCPPGIYWLSHPVAFPTADTTSGWVYTIDLRGVNTVQFNLAAGAIAGGTVPANATVFVAGWEVGDGTSMINATNGHYGRGVFENILYRLPTNPNGGAINGRSLAGMYLLWCAADTGGFSEYDPRIPFPSYQTYAFQFPRTGNFGGGTTGLERSFVGGGFYHGLQFAEHFVLTGFACVNCVNAISPDTAAFDVSLSGLAIEGCVNAFNSTNDNWGSIISTTGMHVEQDYAHTGWWTSATLVNDPANILNGLVVSDAVGWTNVGGTHVSQRLVVAGNYVTQNIVRDNIVMGNLGIDASPVLTGWTELTAQSTNKGFFLKPKSNDPQNFFLFLSPRANPSTTKVNDFLIELRQDQSSVDFAVAPNSGGEAGGEPISFYPYTVGFAGPSLVLQTNGNVIAPRGIFVGDGSGLTNVPGSGGLTAGQVATQIMATNPATLGANNYFTGSNTNAGYLTLGNPSSGVQLDGISGALDVMSAGGGDWQDVIASRFFANYAGGSAFFGNGGGITNLPAAQLTGTIKTNVVTLAPVVGYVPKIQSDGTVGWAADATGGAPTESTITNALHSPVWTSITGNAATATTASAGWPTTWPGSVITAGTITQVTDATNALYTALKSYADAKTNAVGIIQIVTNSTPLAVSISGSAGSASRADLTSNPAQGILGIDGSYNLTTTSIGLLLTNGIALNCAQLTGSLPTNTIPALLPSSITGNSATASAGWPTNWSQAVVYHPTNTSVIPVNMAADEGTFQTNAAFSFQGFVNLSSTNYQHVLCHVIGAGSALAITFPANCNVLGTPYVTNYTDVLFNYSPVAPSTNALCLPIR